MNYMNVQKEILKAAEKENEWKHIKSPWVYAKDDKNVYVSDTFSIWVIPKTLFYLDVEKVFINKAPMSQQFIDAAKKEADYDAIMTRNIRTTLDGRKLVIFKCNGEEVFIDEKKLKDFDMKSAHFRGTNRKSPLQVYEDETIVGVVLPVNVKE